MYVIQHKDGDSRDCILMSTTKMDSYHGCEEYDLMECDKRRATRFETKRGAYQVLRSFSLDAKDYKLIEVKK